ncbi:hypothetical protein J1C56_29215 [Aminobacter anthyllidis]|uniref:Uncharacterized protein n=1 Tax=Aminobacter anthyllidis TaxID=1035067 RepID=A0A9X1AGS3_9HYPH|nr:hypothetical protein [Aminobacter anthyllidis]MBT1159635.1 hypothetical protein [Aminobacter anthyllidis]
MTLDDAKNALISVLGEIQTLSGLACPPLDGGVIPPKVLPKFDSTVWPVATTMVARKLGVTIPNDVHIFGGENGSPLLTIEQTAALICKKAQSKAPAKVAA